MKHENSKKILSHLEFLGYTCEKDEEAEGDVDSFLAKSDSRSNLYIRCNGSLVLIRCTWTGLDVRALKSKNFYSTINALNMKSIPTKVYYEQASDDDLSLVVSALYLGYEKAGFAKFIEWFEVESQEAVAKVLEFAKD